MTGPDLDRVAAAVVAELAAGNNRADVDRVLLRARETVGARDYPTLLPKVLTLLLDSMPAAVAALAWPALIATALADLQVLQLTAAATAAIASGPSGEAAKVAGHATAVDRVRRLYLTPYLDDKESLK